MDMKHLALAACLTVAAAVAAAAPAYADLKMTQTVNGKGLGVNGTVNTVTYIKGLKMRSDSLNGDITRSIIFDVQNQKIYIFDSKKKEADVWDMADFGKHIGEAADTAAMKTSFKPNGKTKQIGGKTATGYDMSISMPTKKSDMQITVTLTGPTWIVKGAPGTADFKKFYLAAAEKGFIFTDPRAAKAQPGQAKATAQMYREIAATGGLPYETDMNIKMSGEGPMAEMMAKMGNMSMNTVVQTADTAPLPDDLFAPPAGYKLSPKK
jgi:hypothetical protein